MEKEIERINRKLDFIFRAVMEIKEDLIIDKDKQDIKELKRKVEYAQDELKCTEERIDYDRKSLDVDRRDYRNIDRDLYVEELHVEGR